MYKEEDSERYFCQPLCQKKYYPLSGFLAERFGESKPGYISSELWNRMMAYEEDRGNLEEKKAINENLLKELRDHITRIHLFHALWKVAIYDNDKERISHQKELVVKIRDSMVATESDSEKFTLEILYETSRESLHSKELALVEIEKERLGIEQLHIKLRMDPTVREKYTISQIQQNCQMYQSYMEKMTLFLTEYLSEPIITRKK